MAELDAPYHRIAKVADTGGVSYRYDDLAGAERDFEHFRAHPDTRYVALQKVTPRHGGPLVETLREKFHAQPAEPHPAPIDHYERIVALQDAARAEFIAEGKTEAEVNAMFAAFNALDRKTAGIALRTGWGK